MTARFRLRFVIGLAPALLTGCALDTAPEGASAHRAAAWEAPAAPECQFHLHAQLRAPDLPKRADVGGTIQLRISPGEDDDAEAESEGSLRGPSIPDPSHLIAEVRRRIPQQAPEWSDTLESGQTLGSSGRFEGRAPMDAALAKELIEEPQRFRVVINPRPGAGGRELEGPVEPPRGQPPAELRDVTRGCF